MSAARKTATVHQIGIPNKQVPVVDYEGARNIITTYYTDTKKNWTVCVRRAKYPRSAVQRAVDNISMGTYSTETHAALVAVVYDENTGQHHCTVRRYMDGKVDVEFHRDPVQAKFAGTSLDPKGTFVKKLSRLAKMRLKKDH